MTTGSEMQPGSDMPWQIPDDWAVELQFGHVIVVPANIHSGALSPRGYIVYAHDDQPSTHGQHFVLDPDKLRETFGFLERTGYTYQGFRPWLYQAPAEHTTVSEVGTVIAQYSDRLTELREAAEDDGRVAWTWTRSIDVQQIEGNVTETIIENDDPPPNVSFEGRHYEAVESSAGLQRRGGDERGREFVSWNYESQEGRLLFILQWGERDFAAYEGACVEEYQFTDILPGGKV